MKNWTLNIVISQFDNYLKEIDYANMPARESEEYRQLVLRTANDVVFCEGRYSMATEWMLEMFDETEVCALVENLNKISRLRADKRKRLAFYLDLKKVCYPLFRGLKVDWSAWPWNLNQRESSFENKELFELITHGDRQMDQPLPCLQAAILCNMQQLIWKNEEERYSVVARQDAAENYGYSVSLLWDKTAKTDEDLKELTAAICKSADDLWAIENHMLVAELLGFDLQQKGIYDSFDTFVDSTYRHNQVLCTRELAAWIGEHWTIGDEHPSQEKVDMLYNEWQALMAKYDVTSPDERYSWNILTLEVLGMSMVPEEEEEDWEV